MLAGAGSLAEGAGVARGGHVASSGEEMAGYKDIPVPLDNCTPSLWSFVAMAAADSAFMQLMAGTLVEP